MTINDLLPTLKGLKRSGEGWTARCPAHDDQRNSLSVSRSAGEGVLLHCHAGCTFEAVQAALGTAAPGLGRAVSTYDYRDEAGALLYQAVRFEPKDFRQRKPDGAGGWSYKLNGVRRVPYRLPELLTADPRELVFIVEGEKDADRLCALGLVATTNAGGAGKWRDEFNDALRGRRVVVIPDNDEPGREHASRVAQSLRGVAADVRTLSLPNLPPKGDVSDWLDAGGIVDELLVLADSAPAFASADGPSPPQAITWPDPEPLPEEMPPVPDFDESLLPEPLRAWVVDVTERMQCPIEFPGVAALVAAASLIGNLIRIRPKRTDDWTVTPNLWGAVVGKPGVLKTPALDEALRPVRARERVAMEEFDEAVRDYEFGKLQADAQLAKLKSDLKEAIKKGRATDHLRRQLDDAQISPPVERRYLVNDPTVEKLGELLNQNPRGLLLFRDELVGWLRSLDREGREQDRTFYLEAWNGTGGYTYDRIGRGTLRIHNLTVSILGGIQPGPLLQYLRGALQAGRFDDGLIQRFQLLVYPDISRHWRNVDRAPDAQAARRAHECFARLDALEAETISARVCTSEAGTGYGFLRFDDAAQEFFDSWRAGLETGLRAGAYEHPALEAHMAKYRSLMPALALLFHLLDVAGGQEPAGCVPVNAAWRAAAWCSLLEAHARRIYGIALGSETQLAKTILERIRRGQLEPEFTARDIYRRQWAGLATPSDVAEPLRLLADYGWLRTVSVGSTTGGGRPSVCYAAHPSLVPEKAEAEG